MSDLKAERQEFLRTESNPLNNEISEMRTLIKLMSYDTQEFHLKWAIIILFTNTYNFFTVPYFLAMPDYPAGIWLGLEFISELLLFLDFMGRVLLRKSDSWKEMWMLHENLGHGYWFCIALSSLPYTALTIAADLTGPSLWVACLKLPKLLRFSQFSNFFTNLRIAQDTLLLEFSKLFLVLLGITHFAGTLWLLIARLEIEYEGNFWIDPYIKGGASDFEIYIDACFWSTSTLTSIGFGDLTPVTAIERFTSICVMIVGASVYAAIFGALVLMIVENNVCEVESQQLLERSKQWCQVRKLPSDLKYRIFTYYSVIYRKFRHLINDSFMNEVPLSLKTEIALFLHKDMIPKVKLFELGDPAFMMGIIRCMHAKLFIAGDYIMRMGEYADELCFVRGGVVEILASDDITAIALLEEGTFFGEIGIFLKGTRSVSVRAKTATIISTVSKKNLMSILKNFPDHKNFLVKIAEQRLRTTHPEDIDQSVDLNQHFTVSNEFLSRLISRKLPRNDTKGFFKRLITLKDSDISSQEYIIDSLSTMYYIWAFLIIGSYYYYLFYIPLMIAFEVQPRTWLMLLDIICYLLYIVDMIVHANTASMTDFGFPNRQIRQIRRNYLNRYLILDLCSILPIDFALIYLGYGVAVSAYFRALRFLKYRRILGIIVTIRTHATYSLSLFKLFQYFLCFVIFSHISACVFFSLIRLEDFFDLSLRYDNRSFLVAFNEQPYQQHYTPLLDLPVEEQYIHLLYWSYSITATGAYGDIVAVTPIEKMFNMIMMILSKCFIAFIYAEAATVMANASRPYTDHLGKLSLLKKWLAHIKAPSFLRSRVMQYYELIWSKLKGHDEEEIFRDLPDNLATDVKEKLFEGMKSVDFFPDEDPGPIRSILKRCFIVMACKGETIINQAEIGLEMYFVVEGEAEVVSSSGIPLNSLNKGMVFGEMAFLNTVTAVRNATVIAKTDITLAVLSLDNFNFVMKLYPDFAQQVRKLAVERKIMNKKTLARARMTHDFVRFSSDLLFVRSSASLITRIFRGKIAKIIYGLAWVWCIIFAPYQMAFQLEFSEALIAIEICVSIVYFATCVHCGFLFKQNTKNYAALLKAVHHLVIALPFVLVLGKGFASSCFSLIRISNFYSLLEFFEFMKQRMTWFNLMRILEVLTVYFAVCHINACLFIRIGIDQDESWMMRIPSPQPTGRREPHSLPLTDDQIYIHALYWSIVTISHIGTGDITPISTIERAYTCLAFLFGCFIYAILFGNISSLVSAFACQLRSKLQDKYSFIIHFLHKKSLTPSFLKPVSEYFNYLWKENKGINEEELLNQLPPSLAIDIQIHRYARAIHNSPIFKPSSNHVLMPLTRSIFKVLEFRYYLTGDTIIHAGDKEFDLYIVLDGEVEVVDFEGNRVIATIGTGGYFGEANLLFNWTRVRTAHVVASSICRLGLIPRDKFHLLIQCYPEWHEMLLSTATERMKETFSDIDLQNIAQQLESIREIMASDPDYVDKTQKRAHKLIALKVTELLREPPPNQWFGISLLHLALLIYSAVAIPFQVAFDIHLDNTLLAIEFFLVVESFIFFLINCRYSFLMKARKELPFKVILSYYYDHFLLEDLIAVSPFNAIFPLLEFNDLTPLRLLRLLALSRVPSLLESIEIRCRQLSNALTNLKALMFLLFLTHWSACFWFWLADDWREYFYIDELKIGDGYLYAVYYTMNTVTSLGYGDLIPTSNLERFLTILIILLGDALFAVAFGLVANSASGNKTEFFSFLHELKAPSKILHKSQVPRSIIKRLETYYAFNAALNRTFGPIDYRCLNEYLPAGIVSSIIYECSKNMLKSLPIISNANSEGLIEKLSVLLTPRIFFPRDFVIYKHDIAEEMYFIMEGTVDVISGDGSKLIASLGKGQYIGEMALIADNTRVCSVVAKSLCLMYALTKDDFLNILKVFPEINEEIQFEAEKRAENYDNEIFSNMNFESMGHEAYKRRPHINFKNERRLSQVSLASEMVLSRFSKLRMQWTVLEHS